MIIDDRIAICGSANINDRSQVGNRDSELCLVFTKGEEIESRIGGKPMQVHKKVHELRIKLFKEHFGFPTSDVKDPLDESFLTNLRMRAKVLPH